MATFSAVTRQHVLQAIAEYDDRGREAFLGVYGFQPSPTATFVHEGKTYDSKGVLGVAHRYATGRAALSEELSGDDATADLLRKCGFDVAEAPGVPRVEARTTAARSAASRPAAARPARRPAAVERPPVICPTCFTALPGTGQCDNCA
ncbi:hypothetical protein [Xylanimonas sp. McL0601]|uniref:hypothetical protein n=1 Tax=Xylanimonas sp. McL0601 TaxID=3414739 RepID=UPI003CE93AE1